MPRGVKRLKASQADLDLIYRQLGHHDGGEDCTREHCDQVTFIAASVSVLMLTQPELFGGFR